MTDLRALLVGAVAWGAALAAWSGARNTVGIAVVLAGVGVTIRFLVRRSWVTGAALVLAAGAAFGAVALDVASLEESPIHRLAEDRASVTAVLVVGTDPVLRTGRFATRASAEATVREVWGRGRRFVVDVPILVVLPAVNRAVQQGTRLRVVGSLRPSDRPERAAVLDVSKDVEVLAPPRGLAAAGNHLRGGVRAAVEPQARAPRSLIPALVAGQDAEIPAEVVENFQTTGMTHLLAVSGTNLTLIVGFLLILARWVGVRARALIGVGILGVGGFLVLAGTEPSVLRAAAMGVIGLIGLGSGGRQRGTRALGIGVLVLVLLDPQLARSVGFALSVTATGAIVALAPRWRDALARWLPRWLAEAIAVPLAAQLACTPLVAAISGQVSLVAVAANMLAAPLIGPATVLGLGAGVVALLWLPAAHLLGVPACWAAGALIAIAERGAAIPVPGIDWSGSPAAIAALSGCCAAAAVLLHRLLARRGPTLAVVGVLMATMLVPLPTPGWPPPGWVAVSCDVGQGDGLVLRVAERSAVIVDVGPDPDSIDRCLRRLGIEIVPMVVLTHFHADHVDGLRGALKGRRVGLIVTSPLAEPVGGVQDVRRIAERARIPVRAAELGEVGSLGALRWQVLAPLEVGEADSESPPNDASVVLLVETAGIRILLMGDQERPSQVSLRRRYPHLRADVLKVAHHGSSKQDEPLVEGLGARVGLLSLGADNDYGHPAASTLALLGRAGIQVHRTDREGDVAVVVTKAGDLVTVAVGGS